jgi:hypothetical protein
MSDTINHDQQIQPCLILPVNATDVEDAEDASVPLPPGLRDIRLSDQEAAAIKNLLDDSGHPTHTGREMPTADASVLLEKNR